MVVISVLLIYILILLRIYTLLKKTLRKYNKLNCCFPHPQKTSVT